MATWEMENGKCGAQRSIHQTPSHHIFSHLSTLIILATLSRTAILDTKPGGKPDDHTSTKVARSVIRTHHEEQGCRSKSSRRMLLGGTASDKIVSRISYSSPGMGTRCSQYCGLHLVITHYHLNFRLLYILLLSSKSSTSLSFRLFLSPATQSELHIMSC